MSQRVLLVTHRFLPKYLAGTELYTAALAKGLTDRGYNVRVFTGDPRARSAYEYEWGGLPVTAVPWGLGGHGPVATFLAGFMNPVVERRFAQLCEEFQPDIVHVQHLIGLSPWLMTIGRHAGARVILTLHDFWYVCSNTWLFRWNNTLCPGPGWGFHCGGCALHRLGIRPRSVWMALSAPLFLARTNVLRHAQRDVDRFVAPSHLSARIFVEQGGRVDRVTVVPSVVLTTHPSQRSQERATDRLLRFVYVGSIIPAKGLHIAVAAFNRLSDARVQFHIYGDLTADPGYAREVQQLAHHPGIEFKGPAAREQVNNILREADLLLLPSLWYESYSIVVDEAFSVGLPVMVSSHGAPAERVIPGINGLAAPPGDVAAWQQHIQRFVNDPDLRIQLRLGMQPPPLMEQHLQVMETIYAR